MKRERIDHLVDIWIDTVSRVEVGWPAESMLAKFIMYRGSFQDSKKPGGLEKYLDHQVKHHARFADIQVALGEIDESKAMAIVASRYFRGLNEKNKSYSNKDRAYLIGQRLRQFENNLQIAYKNLSKVLDLLEKRQKIN
tara:strand:- start:54 stop:470 length:417 start_codon:yes stop_codon:yes gene_type:complete